MSAISRTSTNRFRGFPAEGLKFLKDLKRHNDREWFQPRKHLFDEHVRAPMLDLIAAVHGRMLDFAPAYVGDPKKNLYRIYRDTRFSKDKTPYKTHASALLWRSNLGKDGGAAFYFAISADEVAIGAGLYSPQPDALRAVREEIAGDHEGLLATFSGRKRKNLLGELQGESTTRTPKGFEKEHPAIELIQRKQYLFYVTLKPGVATTPKVVSEIADRFEAATPFIEYLNRPLLALARQASGNLEFR